MSDLLLSALNRESKQQPQDYQPETLEGSNRLEQARAKLAKEMEDARAVQGKSKEDLEVEENAWESEDSLAAAQRFFSSMALGWGDEMGLWTAAAVASATTGNPIKEVYADMRKDYDAKQANFAEDHAGAAMAADIAGSIASPANLLGAGAVGAKVVGSMPSVASGLAAKVPGLSAARGGLNTAAQAKVVGAPALLGRAGAEGAIYGAGEAKEGERLRGLGEGALYGAGGYAALRTVGKVVSTPVDFLTRRRVEGDMVDAAGNFIPITLAAQSPKGSEGFLHNLYRDVIGPAFGAKGVLREQEDVVIKPISNVVEEHKTFTKNLEDAADRQLSTIKTTFIQNIKDQNKITEELKKLAAKEKGKDIQPLESKIKLLKEGKDEQLAAQALTDFTTLTNARRLDFREKAFTHAMPDGATTADRARIAAMSSMSDRMRAVDQLWKVKGYKMLTDRTYRFKAGEVDAKLKKTILSDDYFKVNNVDSKPFMDMVTKIQDDIGFFKDKNGRITGKTLGALRSKLGSVANKATDPQIRRGYYAIQSSIDDMIMAQMPKAAKEAFKRESQKWKSNVILRETVEAANNDTKARGAFTESDWVKEAFKNSKYDKRYATGPLVKDALALESNLKSSEKSISKMASRAAKKKAFMVEGVLKQHKQALAKKLQALEAEKQAAIRKMGQDRFAAEEVGANTLEINKAQKELRELTEQLNTLQKLRTPENPSWFHSLAAHSILATGGFLAGGPVGALASPAIGVGASKLLATQGAQKALAGQTRVQQNIQRMLQSDITGLTADVLGRAGSKGMFTGQ